MNSDTLLQNANILGIQSSTQTGVPFIPLPNLSNTSTTIKAGDINSISPLKIPDTSPNTTANGIISSTIPTPPPDQTTKDIASTKTDIATTKSATAQLLDTLKQKIGLVSDAQTVAATPSTEETQAVKDLADINTQIANTQVSYRGESDAIKARGDVSKEAQLGLQQNLDSKYGRTLADLAIRQSATQGNITAFQTASDRKLALTLAPLETQIKYLEDFAIKNQDNISKDQTQQLNSLIAQKKDEKTAITTLQTGISNLLGEALKNGVKIPDNVVSQVTSAPDIATATSILAKNGISLTNPLDEQYKRAQITKLNADAQAAVAADAAVNPDVLKGMLNVYKSTGVLPAFGLSAKSPLRAQFYAALGAEGGSQIVTDANTNKAVRAGLTTAYKTQQNQLAANQTAIGTLDQQLGLAQSYSDKVSRSASPLVAKYILGVKSGVFGDPDTAALNNIVKTASYEFAKILSGSAASISGVTVSSAADAEQMLNSAMSKGQFSEVLGLMKTEAQYRLKSQGDTLNQLESDLKNVGNLSNSLKDVPIINNANTAKGQRSSINGHTYVSDGTQWVLEE